MRSYNSSFNRWAENYDDDIARAERSVNWMYKDYGRILRKIIAMLGTWNTQSSRLNVLDIGAGTGNLTKLVHDAGYRVTGIEPSDKMLEKFQEKLPSTLIVNGDFLDIPFQKNYADAIVSSYAWHHLTGDEKETSVTEMSRVLKHPGLILIADLMFADHRQRAAKIDNLKKKGYNDIVDDIELECYADISRVSRCLIDHGFIWDSIQMTDYVWIVQANRG